MKREHERRGDRRFRSNRREFKIPKKGNPEKSHFQKQMQTHSLRFPRLFLRYPAQKSSTTCDPLLRFIISFQGLAQQLQHQHFHKSNIESSSVEKLIEKAWTPEASGSQAPKSRHSPFCAIPKTKKIWPGLGVVWS